MPEEKYTTKQAYIRSKLGEAADAANKTPRKPHQQGFEVVVLNNEIKVVRVEPTKD